MTEAEVFIADCHLQEVENQQEYHSRAALFAIDADAARGLLEAHVATLGYRLIWAEDCLRATDYVARHGDQRAIGELARKVHPDHKAELAPLTGKDVDGTPQEPESYLIIEEIEGVEPLDAQFGAFPKKTVPDALYEPLFGQPEPTEEERTQFGNTVPPLKTYAVLDAAKVPMLPTLLETSGLKYQCLFQGEAEKELRDVAPYLVQLEKGSAFTRNLFTSSAMPADLWDKEPGIYIRSRAEFDKVRKHFRKFTRIQDENGKWFLFRFWDANVSRFYFKNIDTPQTYQRLSCIFDGSIGSWISVSNDNCTLFSTANVINKTGNSIIFDQNDFVIFSELSWHNYLRKLLRVLRIEHPVCFETNTDDEVCAFARQARTLNFRTEIAAYNYVRSHLMASMHGIDITAVINRTAGGSPTEHARHMWKEIQHKMESLN